MAALYSTGQPAGDLRQRKAELFAALRTQYQQRKGEWGGVHDHDGWFARPLNNAHLNTVATYYDLVPAFQRRLAANNGDLEKFFREMKGLARLSKAERQRRLE